MNKLTLAFGLALTSYVSFATPYSCKVSSFTPGASVEKTFLLAVPGNVDFTFDHRTVKIFSTENGLVYLRLGVEGKSFPYSYSSGNDFPNMVHGTLALANSNAATVRCHRQ